MTTYDITFFDCTKTWLTCNGWYTQLQLLVQTKPVIAQCVTLIWTKYIFKDKPTSGCCFDITWMPKCKFFRSRRNATFWSKVGEMGVGYQFSFSYHKSSIIKLSLTGYDIQL